MKIKLNGQRLSFVYVLNVVDVRLFKDSGNSSVCLGEVASNVWRWLCLYHGGVFLPTRATKTEPITRAIYVIIISTAMIFPWSETFSIEHQFIKVPTKRTCKENVTYFYRKEHKTCEYIANDPSQSDSLCSNVKVYQSCPMACGYCSSDWEDKECNLSVS